ncbi:MAG: hypothetical protein ABS942_16210 [Solibacillus sp.]|uniref:hypothetical protein n=1 Tax=Solibacillus sp. TaxID=1909654 RepID=UPI0033157D41
MVRFKDLNYGLGKLLHKVETEEDYEEYRYIINALKPNVVKESIKEGYFSKVPTDLIDDTSVKKVYHEKLVKLKMLHLKTKDITSSRFFDYQSKAVQIKSKELEMFGDLEFNANVVRVDFDEQRREFLLVVELLRNGVPSKLFRRYGVFESNIESIVVIE